MTVERDGLATNFEHNKKNANIFKREKTRIEKPHRNCQEFLKFVTFGSNGLLEDNFELNKQVLFLALVRSVLSFPTVFTKL